MAVLFEARDRDSWQTLKICTSIYLMKINLYPKILAKLKATTQQVQKISFLFVCVWSCKTCQWIRCWHCCGTICDYWLFSNTRVQIIRLLTNLCSWKFQKVHGERNVYVTVTNLIQASGGAWLREHSHMTSDSFGVFLTYLGT